MYTQIKCIVMLIMVYLSTVLGFLKPFFLVVAFVRVFIFMFLANTFRIVVVAVTVDFAMESVVIFLRCFFFCWFRAIFQFNSWICTVWFEADGQEESFSNKTDWNNNLNRCIHTHTKVNKTRANQTNELRTRRTDQERANWQKKKSDLVSQLMSILVLCLFLFRLCSFSRAIFHLAVFCTQNFVVGNELAFFCTTHWICYVFVCRSLNLRSMCVCDLVLEK